MKKLFFCLAAALLTHICAFAQINTYGTNVGIGTNPSSSSVGGKLQVADGGEDPTKYGSLQIVRSSSPSDNNFHLSFIRNGTSVSGMGYQNGANVLGIWMSNNNVGTPSMAFTPGQYVGIGTSTPAAKLHVVGGHIAASTDESLSSFTQLWNDNALIWKAGSGIGGLRFGSATDLGAGNWSEKMRLSDNGYLGIGTSSPQGPLHISNNNNLASITLESTSAGWGSGMVFRNIASSGKTYGIYSSAWGALNFTDNNTGVDRISINTDGNVGIGTSIPVEKFQIGDRFTFHDGGWKGILYNMGWNSSLNSFTRIAAAPTSGLFFTDGGNIIFHNAPSGSAGSTTSNLVHSMILYNSGQVGIGTNSSLSTFSDATYKLVVEGGIRTRKVKVDQSIWADYVFEPEYKLLPLPEVEAYIKKHGHLPEVPSTKEVEINGVDLGETQTLLLKKIEELTLHVIAQDKELERLKAQNTKLGEQEKRLEQLQLDLEALKKMMSVK